MNERNEFIVQQVEKFPLFLKIYCAIVFGFLLLVTDIFRKFVVYCLGYPLAIIGLCIYFLIIKPLNWLISLFITIERVDIYE